MARLNEGPVAEGTSWFAMEQTAGKGQRGKVWHSAPGENLLLTTVLQPAIPLTDQFMLSVAISLGACDFFSKYAGDETRIKWSNDTYWRDRKAAGMLIENVLRGNIWQYAIVGIGFNINTGHFPEHLTNAVSLRQITGREWDAIELAKDLCRCFDRRYRQLEPARYNDLLSEYKSKLLRFNETALYRQNGELFEATITDVLPDGRLRLEKNDQQILEPGFGEIEFVFTK